jgi:hypothetical protein
VCTFECGRRYFNTKEMRFLPSVRDRGQGGRIEYGRGSGHLRVRSARRKQSFGRHNKRCRHCMCLMCTFLIIINICFICYFFYQDFIVSVTYIRRSQWPRGRRRSSAAARLLSLFVVIPPGAWMFICCECCVLSGRGVRATG